MEDDTGTPRVLIRGILQRNNPPPKELNTPHHSDLSSENIPFNAKTPTDLLRDRRKSLLQRKVVVGKTPRNMIKGFLQTEGIQRPKAAQTPKVRLSKEEEHEDAPLREEDNTVDLEKRRNEPIPASELFRSIVAAQSMPQKPKDETRGFSETAPFPKQPMERVEMSNAQTIERKEDDDEEDFGNGVMSDYEDAQDYPVSEEASKPIAEDSKREAVASDRGIGKIEETKAPPKRMPVIESVTTKQDVIDKHEDKEAPAPRFPPRASKKLFTSLLRTCGPVSKSGSSINGALTKVTAAFFEQLAGDLSHGAKERSSQKPKVSYVDMEGLLKQQGHITDGTTMEDLIRQLLTREYSDELLDLASR